MADNDDALIALGSGITALGDGRLGGHLIRYGSPQDADLEGDFFTPGTAFDFEDGETRPVYYLHGLDAVLKKRRIGRATLRRDALGIWIEAQLDLRDDYERALYALAADGRLGWSSGAAAHLVERQPVGRAHHIRKWAIAEASLTPAPAEPRAAVIPLKSLAKIPFISLKEKQMEATHELDGLRTRLDEVSAQMQQVLRLMQDAPAVRSAGYFTVDGGSGDAHIKSLGDYLLAIMRGDEKRLAVVYGSLKTTMEGGTGALGGYSIPHEYSTQLMQLAVEQSAVLARVKRIPVNTPAGEYPALDQYFVPEAGAGDTAAAGRLKAVKRAEGAAYNETNPEFEIIRYRVADVASGMIKVTKELRADSPAGIEAFLRSVISIAVGSRLEQLVLRGNGVGEPLGILNAPARVNVSAAASNTFAYGDAVRMVARMKAIGGSPLWVYHPSVINDIAVMQNGSGGPVWQANLSAAAGATLLGHPLAVSEHLPQADHADSVLLADLGAYVLFERGGLYIEFSEHAAFSEGKDTWRFGMRCDGQPWVKGRITLADPQNAGTPYEMSPFVVFTN
jgi:HK97 family phage major capsid protein